QLKDLSGLLKQEMASVAPILRPMLKTIVGEQIKPPGTTLGFPRIRFTIDGFAALRHVLEKKLPAAVLEGLKADEGGASPELTADLGRTSCTEQWAPIIAQWRKEDLTWSEISRRTGLKLATAHLAHKRWLQRGGTS